jgi:DDE superfamily endonuclease
MNIPTWAIPVLTMFRPAFSMPTSHRFLVLVLAAVLTTGRRTVTDLLRTAREKAPGPMSASHRVFSQRRWSAWALARLLITCLLDHVVPPDPVLLAGDDTVTEPPGPRVLGQGWHCDGVRSTHRDAAGAISGWSCRCSSSSRSRHGPGPFPAWRPWSRPPEWDRVQGTRQKTPTYLARLLLARLMRWFPERHFIFVGDSGDGTTETARVCRKHGHHLTLVSKFDGDATLYAPPPPRTHRTMGRTLALASCLKWHKLGGYTSKWCIR